MKNYIGIDVVTKSRFSDFTNDALINKIFTDKEVNYCNSKSKPFVHFAGKFAAKEALVKALNQFTKSSKYEPFEILNDSKGKPFFNLSNYSEFTNLTVSITHDDSIALAVVSIMVEEKL